ncbi:hypothetical protein GT348_08870 [Aristophania vespae]|uniref:Glycosyltransferase n=1 Tax=Aristophania vespae TaxID=2697033 RepID=A0A6P1NKZ1_9PROT|nr:hypothetical protein GT348_08870 [Aristophania vespae]
MLTLDADSVMDGALIVRLTAAMEAHLHWPHSKSPTIVGGHTLFARMQQFAGRIYGPLIAHGVAWWHGSEGNYWAITPLSALRPLLSKLACTFTRKAPFAVIF